MISHRNIVLGHLDAVILAQKSSNFPLEQLEIPKISRLRRKKNPARFARRTPWGNLKTPPRTHIPVGFGPPCRTREWGQVRYRPLSAPMCDCHAPTDVSPPAVSHRLRSAHYRNSMAYPCRPRFAWRQVSACGCPCGEVSRADQESVFGQSLSSSWPGEGPPGVPAQLVAARWVLAVGRSNRTIKGPRKPWCHGVEAAASLSWHRQ